jgi:hypothetical protein
LYKRIRENWNQHREPGRWPTPDKNWVLRVAPEFTKHPTQHLEKQLQKQTPSLGSLSSDPLVPNYETTNSKCFIWCRLGASKPPFLSLSCTDTECLDGNSLALTQG